MFEMSESANVRSPTESPSRERRIVPVQSIFLRCASSFSQGFELGVDEYVTKPFSPRVLMARIAAILRRQESENTAPLTLGGLKLDRVARQLFVDGAPVELSLKEYELMQYFLENVGVALSREAILNHVWNYNYYGDARTIDTHVKKLRSKLGAYGDSIKTIWGVGYKLEADAK